MCLLFKREPGSLAAESKKTWNIFLPQMCAMHTHLTISTHTRRKKARFGRTWIYSILANKGQHDNQIISIWDRSWTKIIPIYPEKSCKQYRVDIFRIVLGAQSNNLQLIHEQIYTAAAVASANGSRIDIDL